MAKVKYGSRQNNSVFRWIYFVLFIITTLWLLSSIIIGKSPTQVLSSAFSKIPNPTTNAINLELLQKDSLIHELEEKLAKCMGSGSFQRGMVIIEGPTLNLRSEPSLSSKIIMRIPANSEVDILFYDTQTYYLQGVSGRWVKITYAGTEGWAWGNFIREI